MPIIIQDLANSRISAPFTSTDTQITVERIQRFPELLNGDYFYATLSNEHGASELVKVTHRSITDHTLTVVRNIENDTPVTGSYGYISLTVNSRMVTELTQSATQKLMPVISNGVIATATSNNAGLLPSTLVTKLNDFVPYEPIPATTSTLGLVSPGNGLTVDSNGALIIDVPGITQNEITLNTTIPWIDLTDKPTTLAGYNITDTADTNHIHDDLYVKLSEKSVASGLATTVNGKIPITALHDAFYAVVDVDTVANLPTAPDNNTLYLTTDTKQLYYKGSLVGNNVKSVCGKTGNITLSFADISDKPNTLDGYGAVYAKADHTHDEYLRKADIANKYIPITVDGYIEPTLIPTATENTLGTIKPTSDFSLSATGVLSFTKGTKQLMYKKRSLMNLRAQNTDVANTYASNPTISYIEEINGTTFFACGTNLFFSTDGKIYKHLSFPRVIMKVMFVQNTYYVGGVGGYIAQINITSNTINSSISGPFTPSTHSYAVSRNSIMLAEVSGYIGVYPNGSLAASTTSITVPSLVRMFSCDDRLIVCTSSGENSVYLYNDVALTFAYKFILPDLLDIIRIGTSYYYLAKQGIYTSESLHSEPTPLTGFSYRGLFTAVIANINSDLVLINPVEGNIIVRNITKDKAEYIPYKEVGAIVYNNVSDKLYVKTTKSHGATIFEGISQLATTL